MKYYTSLVESLPSLQGKCVAITGTSEGLGYWAAKASAAKAPACLIMLNRPSPKADAVQQELSKAAPNTGVFTVEFDLTKLATVRTAADSVSKIAQKYGGIDVFAMNAGIMDKPDVRTSDGFDIQMQVNHLGHFLLTKLLMPSFDSAASAGREVRIVTHSSAARGIGGFGGTKPFNSTYYMKTPEGALGGTSFKNNMERYHQTKLANVIFAMALHSKFGLDARYSKFKALSAAPGVSSGTGLVGPVPPLVEKLLSKATLSAPDGSCSLLTAMFSPSAESGDFYEPADTVVGPPYKFMSKGVSTYTSILRRALGLADKYDEQLQNAMWTATETGLGEKFVIPEPSSVIV